MKSYNLPTGILFTDQYSKGLLETLSIGDYGKKANIKAQFLGYNEDINGVTAKDIMPLSEKWVITLSTQYGCPMKCTFCDVPNIKFKGNAEFEDLFKQTNSAIDFYPNTRYTERLNIHFARMGEPMFNFDTVYNFSKYLSYDYKLYLRDYKNLAVEVVHPVFTTSMPKKVSIDNTFDNLNKWCSLKNKEFRGQAGLQISINSTDDDQRTEMFDDKAHNLQAISTLCRMLPKPLGRKYCLNFALADGYEIDANKLKRMFDSNDFMVKITPIHNNVACTENNIKTSDGYNSFYSYKKAEEDLIKAGFDVLIFVPSLDEEKSIITCGNAILGGSQIKL